MSVEFGRAGFLNSSQLTAGPSGLDAALGGPIGHAQAPDGRDLSPHQGVALTPVGGAFLAPAPADRVARGQAEAAQAERAQAEREGLYAAAHEHDACGVGFIASIEGRRTHRIVEQGLQILINLDHRGAVGADPLMGDGAGILIQIPDQFFREEMLAQGIKLPPQGDYGVGMIFLPKEHASRLACEQEV
jgi:hypothetical protein